MLFEKWTLNSNHTSGYVSSWYHFIRLLAVVHSSTNSHKIPELFAVRAPHEVPGFGCRAVSDNTGGGAFHEQPFGDTWRARNYQPLLKVE